MRDGGFGKELCRGDLVLPAGGRLQGLDAAKQILPGQVLTWQIGMLRGNVGEHFGRGQQIVLLNSGSLAGAIGEHLDGFQASLHFAPPDPVVGLLELAILTQIQGRKHKQASRGYG
jgi:hypothetical protein